MIKMEKSLIRTLNDNNIPTKKIISILSYLRGGPTTLPVKKKDMSNFITKLNREIRGIDMTKVLTASESRRVKILPSSTNLS